MRSNIKKLTRIGDNLRPHSYYPAADGLLHPVASGPYGTVLAYPIIEHLSVRLWEQVNDATHHGGRTL